MHAELEASSAQTRTGSRVGTIALARMAWTMAWRARWSRWCTAHDLDAAYAWTVGLLAAYHGMAVVAAGVGLWALAPALSAIDVAFVVVSASTQTGLLPVPFKDLGTPAQSLIFALVVATSAFLVNHLAPTIIAELRLRQRRRTHCREQQTPDPSHPMVPTTTVTLAVADASPPLPRPSRQVVPAPLDEELAAVVQLRHVTAAYYVCVQAAFLTAFAIHAGTSPAVLTRLQQTGQASFAWSVTQTLSAFHQVPFLLDLAPIVDASGHLDVATLLLTATLVLLGNLLAPLALYAVVAVLARCNTARKHATNPFRRLLDLAPAISPLLLPSPYCVLLLGALVAAGIAVHTSVLVAIIMTTGDEGGAAGSVGEQVLSAVFSATALRTAGLTTVAIAALPLGGQLFYIVSMAVGAGPLTLVVHLARRSTGAGINPAATPLLSTEPAVGSVDVQPSTSTAASLSLLVLQVRRRDSSELWLSAAPCAAAGTGTLKHTTRPLKRRASHSILRLPVLPVPFKGMTSLRDEWPLTAPVRTDTPWARPAIANAEQQLAAGAGGDGVDGDRPPADEPCQWAVLPPPATAATGARCRQHHHHVSRMLAVAQGALALVLRFDVVVLLLALLAMAALEQQPSGDATAGSVLAVRLLFLLASSYGLIGLAPGLVLGVVDGVSPGTKAVLMLVMLLGRLRTFPPAPSP